MQDQKMQDRKVADNVGIIQNTCLFLPADTGVMKSWDGLGGWLHTEMSVWHRELNPSTVTHAFSINCACRPICACLIEDCIYCIDIGLRCINTLLKSRTCDYDEKFVIAMSYKNCQGFATLYLFSNNFSNLLHRQHSAEPDEHLLGVLQISQFWNILTLNGWS